MYVPRAKCSLQGTIVKCYLPIKPQGQIHLNLSMSPVDVLLQRLGDESNSFPLTSQSRPIRKERKAEMSVKYIVLTFSFN